MISNYDPNLYWHVCTYAVTLMQQDYSTTIEVEVGGNVSGFDLMGTAADAIYDQLECDDEECAQVILTNPTGDTLLVQDEDQEEDNWVKEMIVSIVLLKQEKKQ